MNIPKPNNHKFRVIPVAGENIKQTPDQLKELTDDDGNVYVIHHWFTYYKDEPLCEAMLLLATGKHVKEQDIWNYYRKSDKIVFFVVEGC